MFVRCSNCQTQFSLDDRQVGADGVAVRCAVCRYVFRVEPPEGASQSWRVQTVDGDLFEAGDLPTLRVWVREGRLHPDDTISRTGKHWIRLGDMPEFSDAFAGFPDLPEVLSAPDGSLLDAADLSTVGPPPSYAGDDAPTTVSDVVRPTLHDTSERLDMSGLFSAPEPPEDDDESADPDEPDDTVVHPRAHAPSEDTVTVGAPPSVSRTSLFEDSASMVLDDLVAPEPEEPEPAAELDFETSIEVVDEPQSAARKPKHRTRKVRTVAAVEAEARSRRDAKPEDSAVVRVLDPDAAAEEAEPDAAQPRRPAPGGGESSGRRAVSGPSMLGAVTAHVKSEPVRPLTGPVSAAESDVAEPEETLPDPAGVALETVEPTPEPGRRASWPLFAGLGLLCGAAVVFGIPQVRERVFGPSASSEVDEGAPPAALAEVDAAVREGTQVGLLSAASAAKTAAGAEGLSANARADLALAGADAHAAQSIALRLQALHAGAGSDAAFGAEDAADAATQAFADVDVERATPTRLARTRARVRLAQGRPQDEVLPLVPADAPELRALVLGAQLWSDPNARVPSGLISALTSIEEPSVTAQVLLATAYARGGDEVGAAGVRKSLEARAPEDATVRALLGESTAAVAETPEGSTPPAATAGDTAPEDPSGTPEEPDETIIIKDEPKAMSVDKMIEKGCDKVDNGDVSGGLRLLLKAFDRRPNDLDVLVCLGAANRKKGISTTALRYYERALKRSPKFMPALLGAARSASKLGESDKAVGYYRRILAVNPGNAEAKSYVAKKSASDKNPQPKPQPKPPVETGGERKPEPPKRKPEPPKPEDPPSE